MSTAAKATLAATSLSALGIVFFVHRQQKTDQAVRLNTHRHSNDLLTLTFVLTVGNAPRRSPRYGTATYQKRTAIRLRNAETARRRVPKGADC